MVVVVAVSLVKVVVSQVVQVLTMLNQVKLHYQNQLVVIGEEEAREYLL